MIYAVITALVVLVMVLYVVFLRRTDAEPLPPSAQAPSPLPSHKTREVAQPAGAASEPFTGRDMRSPPSSHSNASLPIEPSHDLARETDARDGRVPDSQPAARIQNWDISGLRKGLAKTRGEGGFLGRLANLFRARKQLDPSLADQIEEVLLTSDVGVKTTQTIMARLRDGLMTSDLASSEAVWTALREEASRMLHLGSEGLKLKHKPTVVFMVGVNGVGKTTTIGKLATQFKAEGKSVLLAAGDTFRAAAVAQLETWGKRVGCEVVRGKDGADPGAVIFEAIQKARAEGVDIVLADSAGRLQTKTPLMDELKKVTRTMQKAMDGAPHETLLVLDATNGQNAISQATMFQEAIPLSGIVLTKLDGTARGGVILGICDELQIPVRYVGLGERAEDLREFVADEFVEALFGGRGDETAAA